MLIYTITIICKEYGYVAHIETHNNAKKAEERLDYHKNKWNKEEYRLSMNTTLLGLESENLCDAVSKMNKQLTK